MDTVKGQCMIKQRLVTGFEIHQKINGRYLIYSIEQDGQRMKIRGDYEFYANALCALAGRLFQ